MGSGQSCPRVNTTIPENGSQWSLSNGRWDNVKLGWLIAGLATLFTTVICMFATYRHARHYHRPKEQRQIIRILWMPMIFAIISFFSYRYYRYYIYYKLVFIVYEAFCLMAFLALMLAYIGNSTEEQMAVMQSKDKRPLPWPMGCLRYRPSKPYFLYALNLSVLQYAFLRPLLSIVAMICHSAGVLCANKMSPHFAYIYLEVVDFTSISIALYGLVVFYTLVKSSLQGKRPLMKFMLIKVLVALTYYQAFIFSALVRQGVIKPNRYWSKTNIADGLNAIVICIEMVIFAGLMLWAYPVTEYRAVTSEEEGQCTNPWKAFVQALNFWDYITETWRGVTFLIKLLRTKHDGEKGGVVEENEDPDQDTATNLDIYAAFNQPHRRASRISTKYEMSDVESVRSRVPRTHESGMTSRAGSYLDMDDDSDDEGHGQQKCFGGAATRESVRLSPSRSAQQPTPSPTLSYYAGALHRNSSMLARTAPGVQPSLVPDDQYGRCTEIEPYPNGHEYRPPSSKDQPYLPPKTLHAHHQHRAATPKLERIAEVPSSQEKEKDPLASDQNMELNALSAIDSGVTATDPSIIVKTQTTPRVEGAMEMETSPPESHHRNLEADPRAPHDLSSEGALLERPSAGYHVAEAPTQRASTVPVAPSTTSYRTPVRAETSILHEPFTFSPLDL